MKLEKRMKYLLAFGIAKKVALAVFLLWPTAADAEPLVSEIKGGLLTQSSSILDADDFGQFWTQKDETGGSVNAEVLFNGPDWLRHIYTPRIQLGANISTADETNYAYTGLQWDGNLTDSITVGGFFGLMVHDGIIERAPTDPRYNTTRMLGSRVLFRLGPEIAYHFDAHNSLMVTWAHSSNGWMLNGFDPEGKNEGLDQIGVRYGYKF